MRIIIFTFYLDEKSSQKDRPRLTFSFRLIRDVKRLTSHLNKSLLLTLSTAQSNERRLVEFLKPTRITNVDFMCIKRWVWCVYAFELIVLSLLLRILISLSSLLLLTLQTKRRTFLMNKLFQPISGDISEGRFIFMKLELLSCLVARVV